MPGNYGTRPADSVRRRWLASLAGCTLVAMTGGGACMGGDIQIAVPKTTARVLAIGPIENRDARYSPFTTQNFVDMLDFELVRLGYDTLRARDLDTPAKDESDAKPKKKSEQSDSPKRKTPEAQDDSGTADPAATDESEARRQPEQAAEPAREGETPGALEGETQGDLESETPPAGESQQQTPPLTDDAEPAGEFETSPVPEDEAESVPDNESESETEVETPPANEAEPTGDDDGAPVVHAQFLPAGGGPRGGLLEYLAQAGDKKRASDSVSDLLPEYLQDVAGQKPPAEIAASGGELTRRRRQYSKQEIADFFKEHPADFFLQGSIGRTESGDLLDSEQNTLIFLEIYGRTGERIGVVSFLIRGETLAAPNILRDVCEEVVEAISIQVLK